MLTFNSLSRDHAKADAYNAAIITREAFNSLSRDHRQFLLRVGIREGGFQLPLSGSPSPIPGFSGSPRRSAAAPLRTNDS